MQNQKSIHYFDSSKKDSFFIFSRALSQLLTLMVKDYQEVVILCIGSDRLTGDSLGPLIGYKLSKRRLNHVFIYGTLEDPVHALNLEETINSIYKKFKNPFIIAIDASLGTRQHLGYITLAKGTLKPGAGVKKDLSDIGHISITGIVNISGISDILLLQTTRLNVVMTMADYIALGIQYALRQERVSLAKISQ